MLKNIFHAILETINTINCYKRDCWLLTTSFSPFAWREKYWFKEEMAQHNPSQHLEIKDNTISVFIISSEKTEMNSRQEDKGLKPS